MTQIDINTIIDMFTQSMGIETAEKTIDEAIQHVGLPKKSFYTQEEFERICDELKKKGGYIAMVATIIQSNISCYEYYQTLLNQEKKEKENITQWGKKIEALYHSLSESHRELEKKTKELQVANEKLQSTNRALEETQEQIIRSEKLAAIGKLASGVGHELRNPLSSLKNIAFLFNKRLSQTDPTIREFTGILSKEVDHMNKIISDLLDFSRVKKLDRSIVQLDDIIDAALSAAHVNESKNVRVMREKKELISAWIDPDRMRQVFVNIFTNALQAMPDGGEIKVRTESDDENVRIIISDTGCGMSQETKEHIFDPLFTTKAKGIGLGMAIVHDIIEQHHGKIGIESKEGTGTTVIVSLPKTNGGNIG